MWALPSCTAGHIQNRDLDDAESCPIAPRQRHIECQPREQQHPFFLNPLPRDHASEEKTPCRSFPMCRSRPVSMREAPSCDSTRLDGGHSLVDLDRLFEPELSFRLSSRDPRSERRSLELSDKPVITENSRALLSFTETGLPVVSKISSRSTWQRQPQERGKPKNGLLLPRGMFLASASWCAEPNFPKPP